MKEQGVHFKCSILLNSSDKPLLVFSIHARAEVKTYLSVVFKLLYAIQMDCA